jgi:D-tyrosyl-tRNA(Tyr) deacylase
MRAVVTRVEHASVTVDGAVTGAIGRGFLVLLGVAHADTEAQAVKLADKITGLRIFEDENGKMNRSLADVGGALLVVSQFTLYGNCRHGRRPDFLAAARPETAIPLYERVSPAVPGAGLFRGGGGVRRPHGGGLPQQRPADDPAGYR